MTHGSLFSGIGGFDLAASWCGWENVFEVEKDKFCRKVLEKNFPEVTRYEDIFDFDGTKYSGKIDVISGGFPCQPFSVAGKRKGTEDDRHLWPEMLRVISEIRPTWVVGENVAGIINMALDDVLSSLEAQGYTAQAVIIPACAVGAPHRRDRVWIIANSDTGDYTAFNSNSGNKGLEGSQRRRALQQGKTARGSITELHQNVADSSITRSSTGSETGKRTGQLAAENAWNEHWLEAATRFCRVDAGVSHRVDRLKGLGNAIVPQVAFEIFKAIDFIYFNHSS